MVFRRLSDFALSRPVTALMLLLGLGVLGALAWLRIPLQRLPKGYDPPFAQLVYFAPNRSVTDNERQIAMPVEEVLGTVRGLDRYRTTVQGDSVIFALMFEEGIDMGEVTAQLRDRLDRISGQIPEDIARPIVRKFDPDGIPVMWITVRFPDAIAEPGPLLDREVVRRLERVPGVSGMRIWGLKTRAVHVSVDSDKAQARGVDTPSIIAALQAANFTLGAGSITEGGTQVRVRSEGVSESLEALRDLPVGSGIQLREVATVDVREDESQSFHRLDALPAVTLGIFKSGETNAVDVCKNLRHALEVDLPLVPQLEGVEFATLWDDGLAIEESMGALGQAGIWGALIAVLVLSLFLRDFRMILVVATAIPLSLLVTLTVLYFAGESLNALSMMGLMLSIGMVVDNAIVVVESIQRRFVMGDRGEVAARVGASQVATAIVTSTLTSVVVFLPIIFLSGSETISFFLGKIGFPVCYALMASLLVALVFVPLASVFLPSPEKRATADLPMPILRVYASVLRRAIRHPADSIMVTIVLVILTIGVANSVPEAEQAQANINDVSINLQFPAEWTFSDMSDTMLDFERHFVGESAELGVDHILSLTPPRPGDIELRLFLKSSAEQPLEREVLLKRVTDYVEEQVPPGVRWRVGWQGPRRGAEEDALAVRVLGPDADRAAELSEEVRDRLEATGKFLSVSLSSGRRAAPELHFDVEQRLASRYGLSPLEVAVQLGYHTRGQGAGQVWIGGEPLDLRIETQREDRSTVEATLGLPLQRRILPEGLANIGGLGLPVGAGSTSALAGASAAGATAAPADPEARAAAVSGGVETSPASIGDVARVRIATGERKRVREDRRAVTGVTTRPDGISDDDAKDVIRDTLAEFVWPAGYGWDFGKRQIRLQAASGDSTFTLLLAVALVFLLMGALFESLLLPLVVVGSIPFAFTGAFWLLFATGLPYDYMAKVGMVILVGVVVNNAIVLVDRIEQLRREGLPIADAAEQGSRERLRPVLMTAGTTVCGLIPMVIGEGGVFGISYRPLGLAVMGGLVTSTAITLLLVPVLVTIARRSTDRRDKALQTASQGL